MKFTKKQMIISLCGCLIPLVPGLILWNRLPDRIATHFNFQGEPDGFMSKPMAVLAIPLFLLIMDIFMIVITNSDPKNHDQSRKMYSLVTWIMPAVGLMACFGIYPRALGYNINTTDMARIFMGLLFMIIGNYMPKCRPSYTIGIKLPWTLASEENWTRTHRMAGPVWVAGGLLTVILGFIPGVPGWSLVAVLMAVALIPSVYSYILYKRSEEK